MRTRVNKIEPLTDEVCRSSEPTSRCELVGKNQGDMEIFLRGHSEDGDITGGGIGNLER